MKQSPEQVLNNHLQAIGSGNMEALMHDYTEASVFITLNGTFKGLAEIQAEFTNLLELYPPGSTFNLINQSIYDHFILLIWSGESTRFQIPFASDSFVIDKGKIAFQTFAGQLIPK